MPFAEPPPISTAAEGAQSVFAADVDGDGDLDVLSASRSDDKIAWYENTAGDGSAWVIHTISLTADFALSVFAGDLDGDGDVDVLSASRDDNKIAWYENDGSGGGWTLHTISIGVYGVRSVHAADVDGDGDLDVLSASATSDSIDWHENNGDGTAWTIHTVSGSADAAFSVVAADVDSDGDVDVLSASAGDNKIAWYENTAGDGSAWTLRTISVSADTAYSVFAADVDGDGDVDALSASAGDDKIAWYENTTGDGTAWTVRTISNTANNAAWVFARDLDGDGDVDALSASRLDDKIAWYENITGDGTAWNLHTITAAAGGARAAVAADVDGDGDIDALSAATDDNEIAWYRNDTIHRSALFPEDSFISSEPFGPYSVFAADIDGDGDKDALSASYFNGLLAWFENDGAGNAWTLHTISNSSYYTRSVFAADVDGDGDIDILATSYDYDSVSWYENDGDGGGWTLHTVTASADGPYGVLAADVDGDGDSDVLVATSYDDRIAWYENDGTGTSWTLHTISETAEFAYDVFAADIDGDGDLDVLSASYGDDKIAWYENTAGDGSAWALHTITESAYGAQSVFASDVDGDGDIDVLSGSVNDNKVAWYENNGAGTAWTAHVISLTATGAWDVSAADFDGDGDVDVISASRYDNKIAWYENDGTGDNWTLHTVTVDLDEAVAAFPADLDGDGDLDVLSASNYPPNINWHENKGGQFALPTLDVAQKVAGNGQLLDLLDIQTIHRGRMGDSDVEVATWELKFTDDSGNPLTSGEANALIDELRLYRDDGSGAFEDGADTLITAVDTLSLTNGVHSETLVDDNANLQTAFGTPGVLFGVVVMAADAESQSPSAFQVTHLTESSSTGEDAAHDIPLTLEFFPDTGTGAINTQLSSTSCKAPFDLQLANRSVDDTLVCEAGTVLSAENFNLTGSADVTFRSGDRVILLPGFSVQTGQFAVQIDPALQP